MHFNQEGLSPGRYDVNIKGFSTQLGRFFASEGYDTRRQSFCHDYIYVNGVAIAYITRRGEAEEVSTIEIHHEVKPKVLSVSNNFRRNYADLIDLLQVSLQ